MTGQRNSPATTQQFVTEWCWNDIWNRPGLGRKTRSLLNLPTLTALNRQHELAAHVSRALNNGVSRAETTEVLLQAATTTIYVTHDQIEAMTMADKIVVMRDGIIEQMGSPLDLYDRPAMGSTSMNFLEGSATLAGFKTRDGITLPLGENQTEAAIYGVRPEHLHLDPKGIPAEVVVVEPAGSETQVVMRIGTDQLVGVFRERIAAKPSGTINVVPDIGTIHLFDRNGRRSN